MTTVYAEGIHARRNSDSFSVTLAFFIIVALYLQILNCGPHPFSVSCWLRSGSVVFKIMNEFSMTRLSQGIGIYTLVQPCCTSRLLWRRGRVSDCHPGDPGSIPVRVRSEDIFSSPVTFGAQRKIIL